MYLFQDDEIDTDKLIIAWLCHKNLPLKFFDDDFTQHFFSTIKKKNLDLPKRNATTDKLHSEFKAMKENTRHFLAANESKFSFTFDGWTAANFSSFYGITIHLIVEDWFLVSFGLDLVPAEGKHTGIDMAYFFYNTAKEFGIEHKIQGITVDNANVNDTFITNLQEILAKQDIFLDVEDMHFRCMDHIINLGVQAMLKSVSEKYAETQGNAENDEETEDAEDLDFEDDEKFPDDEESLESSMTLNNIFQKVRSTSKIIRRSGQLRIMLKGYCEMKGIV